MTAPCWRSGSTAGIDRHPAHGLSIPKIEAKYRPYLDGLASRAEFTYLSEEMLGEIIGGYPSLIDSGGVNAPRYAIYGLHGEFEVEGHGIPPDIEVEEIPKDVAAGHDLQLEKAVQVVLDQLREHPVPAIPIPPYPNYHQNDGLGVK
jgi:hypothetical protein